MNKPSLHDIIVFGGNKMIKKEILEKLYLDEEMTMHEIAEFLDVRVGSVYNYIKKYVNIEKKS